MVERLNATNFFRFYIFHSSELSKPKDRCVALTLSIALAILTLGLVHLISGIALYRSHSFRVLLPEEASSVPKLEDVLQTATPKQSAIAPVVHKSFPSMENPLLNPKLIQSCSPTKSINDYYHEWNIKKLKEWVFELTDDQRTGKVFNSNSITKGFLLDSWKKIVEAHKDSIPSDYLKSFNEYADKIPQDLHAHTAQYFVKPLCSELLENSQNQEYLSDPRINPITAHYIGLVNVAGSFNLQTTKKKSAFETTLINTLPNQGLKVKWYASFSQFSSVAKGDLSGNEFDACTPFFEDRLATLEREINFSQRFRAQKNSRITFQDLELPWLQSGLRFSLMYAEELQKVSIRNTKDASVRELKFLKETPRPLLKAVIDESLITPQTIDNLPIWQIPLLSDDKLNEVISYIPQNLLWLLTSAQIQKIQVLNLRNSFEHLFSHIENQIDQRLLSAQQINGVVDFFDKERISKLTPQQEQELDLSQILQWQFDYLYVSNYHSGLKKLTLSQVIQGLDKFAPKTVRNLPTLVLKQIDLSQLPKPVFDQVFLPKDDPKSEYSESQVLLFSPEQFQKALELGLLDAKGIRKEKIYDARNVNDFVKNVDFSPLSQDIFLALVPEKKPAKHSGDAVVTCLTKDQMEQCKRWLQPGHISYLSADQKSWLGDGTGLKPDALRKFKNQ